MPSSLNKWDHRAEDHPNQLHQLILFWKLQKAFHIFLLDGLFTGVYLQMFISLFHIIIIIDKLDNSRILNLNRQVIVAPNITCYGKKWCRIDEIRVALGSIFSIFLFFRIFQYMELSYMTILSGTPYGNIKKYVTKTIANIELVVLLVINQISHFPFL